MAIKKNKIYYVGGVNGVGKSSLIGSLLLKCPEFEVFPASKKFMEWLGLCSGDYKTLDELDEAYKDKEIDKMIRKTISERTAGSKTLIIDGHYFNYKRGETVSSVGDWISLVDALFVISASPENVLKRLEIDAVNSVRTRDLLPPNLSSKENLEVIDKFLKLTESKAREISDRYAIPLFLVENNSTLVQSVNEFILKAKKFYGKIE